MSRLFNSIVRPTATVETPGAFLGGLRVMAVDGTVIDVPDSQANARVFGYPGSRKGTRAAFPKVRVVLLIETGTHLITDALMCPYRIGERVRALKLLRSVNESMLLMWEEDFILIEWSTPHYSRMSIFGKSSRERQISCPQDLDDGSYLSWINPDRTLASRFNGL